MPLIGVAVRRSVLPTPITVPAVATRLARATAIRLSLDSLAPTPRAPAPPPVPVPEKTVAHVDSPPVARKPVASARVASTKPAPLSTAPRPAKARLIMAAQRRVVASGINPLSAIDVVRVRVRGAIARPSSARASVVPIRATAARLPTPIRAGRVSSATRLPVDVVRPPAVVTGMSRSPVPLARDAP